MGRNGVPGEFGPKVRLHGAVVSHDTDVLFVCFRASEELR